MAEYTKIAGFALSFCMAVTGPARSEEFVTLATGGVTGVYYAVGGAICRMVNRDTADHGFRCSVESTGGSVYNVNTIRAGELDVAIAQSDVQYQAYNGTGKFEADGAFEELRAVFAVHPESFTIIARKDAGITEFSDLVGKRVNIGNPGSGTEAIWSVAWQAMGFSNDDLAMAAQMKSAETPAALCDNSVDAIAWVAGHPLAGALEASSTCEVSIIPVTGDAIDELVNENPYFAHSTIPGGMYEGTDEDVQTFGVGAVFVSSTNASEDMIYAFTKAVFDNFETFKQLHPALEPLTIDGMIANAMSSPMHPGAIKYFTEAGHM